MQFISSCQDSEADIPITTSRATSVELALQQIIFVLNYDDFFFNNLLLLLQESGGLDFTALKELQVLAALKALQLVFVRPYSGSF